MTCGECGNVTAPGLGFPNHVYCKRFLLHMEKRKDASRCRDFVPKPITNYDLVRAMSIEELANFIVHRDCCPGYVTGTFSDVNRKKYGFDGLSERCDYGDECNNCWIDWLKQEANV